MRGGEGYSHDLVIERNQHSACLRVIGIKTALIFKTIRYGGWYDCVQSHHIKTPCQGDIGISSHTSEQSRNLSLLRAIWRTTHQYKVAIRNGHSPREEWFVPYEGWNEFI